MCFIFNDGEGSPYMCDTCIECETLREELRNDFKDADIPLVDNKGNQWKVNFAPDGYPDGSLSLL